MTKVMTLQKLDSKFTVEIHVLNAGEIMEGFGGSRNGLKAIKTASLITREHEPATGTRDTEHDINDPKTWDWLAKRFNDESWVAKITDVNAEQD